MIIVLHLLNENRDYVTGFYHLDRDACVNFIKTIFQILRNDLIDKVQFSNYVCKYQMFLQKKQDKKDFVRTSNFFQITCPGTSRTYQYFHIPVLYVFYYT